MSSCEISGRPQSVTSVECRDTQTNKFNPRLMIIMEAHVIFMCECAEKRASFVIFARSGEDIYYARPFPKWAMKRTIMQ